MYNEPIADSKYDALRLPKMRLHEKWDYEIKGVLKELEGAQVHFSMFQDKEGELKVLHSGLNEELIAVTQTALHRNIDVHEFFKINLINIDLFRAGKMMEANEMMTQAVSYFRIKESKNLYR